jgi:heme-degrading monooxygenase HmoA
MILESAVLQIKPGQTAAFEAAFARAQQYIAAASGYLGHELQRCLEDDHQYLLLVRWRALEDHTHGFRGSPGYQQWRTLLHHFYDPFPTVLHHTAVPGASLGAAPVAASTHAVQSSF